MRAVHFAETSIGPTWVFADNVNGVKPLTKAEIGLLRQKGATEGHTYVSTGDDTLCFTTPETVESVVSRLIHGKTVYSYEGSDQGLHKIKHGPTDKVHRLTDSQLDDFWRSPLGLDTPHNPDEKLPESLDKKAVHLILPGCSKPLGGK